MQPWPDSPGGTASTRITKLPFIGWRLRRRHSEPAGVHQFWREARETVTAARVVSPDDRQVAEHGQPVSHDSHLRARLVGPVDGDLGDAVSAPLGHIEHLEIESEAVDRSIAEQFLRDIAGEQFEAALGVRNPFDAALPHGGVE